MTKSILDETEFKTLVKQAGSKYTKGMEVLRIQLVAEFEKVYARIAHEREQTLYMIQNLKRYK